jgi:hypothetical protein
LSNRSYEFSHHLGDEGGGGTFSLKDHRATTSKVKAEIKNQNEAAHKPTLLGIISPLPRILSRTIMRGSEMGAFNTVLPSTISSTELSSDEFCDSLNIRYGRTPVGLQPTYGGCGASFNTHHDVSCAKGGLLIILHTKLCEELCGMAFGTFHPPAVRDKQKIHKCRPAQAAQPCTTMAENEDRGDVLIRGLLERGARCILDVRVTDTDAPTCQM